MHKLSTAQLAEYLAVTKRTIQRRAVRENWPYAEQVGLGGKRKIYAFSSLPADVKQKIIAYIVTKHEQQGLDYVPMQPSKADVANVASFAVSPFIVLDKANAENWLSQHCFAYELDIAEFDKDYIKVGLLVLARLYLSTFSLGKIKGFDQFCQLYNARKLAINNAIYATVTSISRITLLRWEKQLEQQHLTTDESAKVLFGADLQQMAQELLLISPNINAKRLRQHFLSIFDNRKIPSARLLGLWLKQQSALKTLND